MAFRFLLSTAYEVGPLSSGRLPVSWDFHLITWVMLQPGNVWLVSTFFSFLPHYNVDYLVILSENWQVHWEGTWGDQSGHLHTRSRVGTCAAKDWRLMKCCHCEHIKHWPPTESQEEGRKERESVIPFMKFKFRRKLSLLMMVSWAPPGFSVLCLKSAQA